MQSTDVNFRYIVLSFHFGNNRLGGMSLYIRFYGVSRTIKGVISKRYISCFIHYDATKLLLGFSDKARLKPVISALETSLKISISPVASLDVTRPKHYLS